MTPASIRNNNPGAQEPGYASKRFGSTSFETLRWKDKTGKARVNRIATFPTPQHGAAACFHLLGTSKHYVGQPISKAVTTWCGGYSASGYAKALQSRAGLSGDTILTADLIKDPSFAVPLLMAMAKWEAGREFPMDEEGFRQGHAMAFGDGLAPAPSPDNDVPAQKPEGQVREQIKTATDLSVKYGPPAAVSIYITIMQAWQAVADQISGMLTWMVANPLSFGVTAAAGGLLWLSKKAEGWS
jgi:hypothetical protein